jgi:broad specificity phosphatase PhoE
MPVILCRHGATGKNIQGGTDDRWTRLHADGVKQAAQTGLRLAAFCRANAIARLQPITSGYARTDATCDATLPGFAASGIEVLPPIRDDRIGEIKFKPRDIVPSPDTPGIFGRVIDGPSLAEVVDRLTAFDDHHLKDASRDTLIVCFGHRTTNRLLAMIHLGRDIGWIESLPRMDNCELWLLENREIAVIHPGYPTARDEADPRRDTLPSPTDQGRQTGN